MSNTPTDRNRNAALGRNGNAASGGGRNRSRSRRAGMDAILWARNDLRAPETFTLSSPAFAHEAPMPRQFRGRLFGPNVSPELAWTAPPEGTVSLLLVVQDPDVPLGKPATHVLAAGIDPRLGGIPEGGLARKSSVAGLVPGRGPLGRRSWFGPMPPRGHGPHAYVFQLFALDYRPELPAGFSLAAAQKAMTGHVIARARVDGMYENR